MLNVMNQLFLSMLSMSFDPSASVTALVSEQQLFELAKVAGEQKLLPILLDTMTAKNCLPAGQLASAMKTQARNEIVAQTISASEQEALLLVLRNAGIPAFTVKGEVCAMTYPKPALRTSGDADILVPKARFIEACNLLVNDGFEPESESFEGEFEVAFHKPGQMLRVELHNSLFPPEDAVFNAPEFHFTAENTPEIYMAEDGFAFHSLPPMEHLLYLILHAYKHFIHSGFGLRQACDIALWSRAYAARIDWELLRQQCESVRCFKFAMAILQLCETELGIANVIPAPWLGEQVDYMPLLTDMLEGGIYGGTDMSRRHSATITLNAVAAERENKRSGVLQSVFPKAKDLSGAYPVLKKHPYLLPGVWAVRLAKYGKELASAKGGNNAGDSLRIGSERKELLKYYDII